MESDEDEVGADTSAIKDLICQISRDNSETAQAIHDGAIAMKPSIKAFLRRTAENLGRLEQLVQSSEHQQSKEHEAMQRRFDSAMVENQRLVKDNNRISIRVKKLGNDAEMQKRDVDAEVNRNQQLVNENSKLVADVVQLQSETATLRQKLDLEISQRERLTGELTKLSEDSRREAVVSRKELDLKTSQNERLEEHNTQLSEHVQQLTADFDAFRQEVDSKAARNHELMKENTQLVSKIEACERRLSSESSRYESLMKVNKQLCELDQLRVKKINELHDWMETIQEKYQELSDRNSELARDKQAIEEEKVKMMTDLKQLDEERSKMDQLRILEASKRELQIQLDEKDAQIGKITVKWQCINDKQEEELERLQTKHENAETRIATLDAELRTRNERGQKLETELIKANSEKGHLEAELTLAHEDAEAALRKLKEDHRAEVESAMRDIAQNVEMAVKSANRHFRCLASDPVTLDTVHIAAPSTSKQATVSNGRSFKVGDKRCAEFVEESDLGSDYEHETVMKKARVRSPILGSTQPKFIQNDQLSHRPRHGVWGLTSGLAQDDHAGPVDQSVLEEPLNVAKRLSPAQFGPGIDLDADCDFQTKAEKLWSMFVPAWNITDQEVAILKGQFRATFSKGRTLESVITVVDLHIRGDITSEPPNSNKCLIAKITSSQTGPGGKKMTASNCPYCKVRKQERICCRATYIEGTQPGYSSVRVNDHVPDNNRDWRRPDQDLTVDLDGTQVRWKLFKRKILLCDADCNIESA